MKFLYNYFGRGLFNIYVGLMPLVMIPDNPITDEAKLFKVLIIVVVSLMLLIGILYIVAKVFCCAKEQDKIDAINKKNRLKRK